MPQLIDAHHVMVVGWSPDPSSSTAPSIGLYAVVDVPEVRYHWFQLPNIGSEYPVSRFVVVGPGLDQVAWVSTDHAHNLDKVHVTSNSGDSVLAALPIPSTAGGCGGGPDVSAGIARYSHSGNHLFVLDVPPFPSTGSSLVVLEGRSARLSLVPPDGKWPAGEEPGWAIWSPTTETLYYRQKGDVWSWTSAGGAQRFLPGVNWSHPTISADGRLLAYAILRSDGTHNVYLVDLANRAAPKLIGNGARTQPVFLNSSLLWYRTDHAWSCIATGSGFIPEPVIYDATDGTEFASIVLGITATWPATHV